jgi:predicted transcriptional regulator
MNGAHALRQARRRAGLTQRELAQRAGVPQSAIARIESGRVVPRIDTLDRLLRVCGDQLEAVPKLGEGIDRTLIRNMLKLTPDERLDLASAEGRNLAKLLASRR